MGIYKINEFGVKPDGKTISTERIQKAIDTCHENGGGKVIFEKGIYKTGTIVLKSNVEIHLENGCRIVASENIKDYKEIEVNKNNLLIKNIKDKNRKNPLIGLIIANESENISISGNGEIDGSGIAFYKNVPVDEKGNFVKPDTPRPRMIMFYKCKNISIENVNLFNSSCYMVWIIKSENINIHKIKIFADKRMKNIDGIHINSCKNVVISDCIIDSEDDSITIRATENPYDNTLPLSENISVSNCILKTNCNGIRIGYTGDGEIKNCLFTNLIIEGKRGIIFQFPKVFITEILTPTEYKTYNENKDSKTDIHDILFSNITIKSNLCPVWITIENDLKLKRISDIKFSDIKIIESGGSFTIEGNKKTKIYNLSFNNIEIQNLSENLIICKNCENVRFNNFSLFQKEIK